MGPLLLFAPTGYWCLTPEGKKSFCNGCGAKGVVDLVPDTIWGLDIKECCNIHDYMYSTAESAIAAKDEADRSFLNNMLRTVNAAGGLFKGVRRKAAYGYYEAVQHFGGPAFWKGKNKIEEEKFV